MSSILSYLRMTLVPNNYPLLNFSISLRFLFFFSVQGFKLPKPLGNYLQTNILQNKITVQIKVIFRIITVK